MVALPSETGIPPKVHYLNADYGIRSWLLTTDHKRIGILYLISITFFFAIGGLMAVLSRTPITACSRCTAS